MSQSKPVVRPRSQRKPAEADLGFSWGPVNGVLLVLGMALILVGYLALFVILMVRPQGLRMSNQIIRHRIATST